MLDQLLERVGLKYEELSVIEKETLNSWMDALQKGNLTLEKVRDYIKSMRDAVSNEISNESPFIRVFIFKVQNSKLIQLQARLKNYILLDAFMSSPEKAKQQIENAISGMVGKKTI